MRVQDADVKLKIITERKDDRLVYTVSVYLKECVFPEKDITKKK